MTGASAGLRGRGTAARSPAATRLPAAILALLLGIVPHRPAGAYFEESDVGARSAGFGKAFTAIADDASAIYWNPAGLVRLSGPEVILVHSRPYSIPDLASNYVAVAVMTSAAAFGASWHHLGAAGVISEDTFTFAAARELASSRGGLRVSVGGALKLGRVSFPEYVDPVSFESVDFGSSSRIAADVGSLVSFPNRMSLGYSLRNIGSPVFDVLEGGGGTELPLRHRIGAAYQWNPESRVSVDYQQIHDDSWILNFGGEIWFYRAFAMRAGVNKDGAGGGVGVKARRWLVDLSFVTNGPLGVSYRAGLKVPFRLFGSGGTG